MIMVGHPKYFSATSLVKTKEVTTVNKSYSIYFDRSTIVWLSRLLILQQVFNDCTWACWCIILPK